MVIKRTQNHDVLFNFFSVGEKEHIVPLIAVVDREILMQFIIENRTENPLHELKVSVVIGRFTEYDIVHCSEQFKLICTTTPRWGGMGQKKTCQSVYYVDDGGQILKDSEVIGTIRLKCRGASQGETYRVEGIAAEWIPVNIMLKAEYYVYEDGAKIRQTRRSRHQEVTFAYKGSGWQKFVHSFKEAWVEWMAIFTVVYVTGVFTSNRWNQLWITTWKAFLDIWGILTSP